MRNDSHPEVVATGKRRSNGAALKVLGGANRQARGRWVNNRAESSHPLSGNDFFASHEIGPFRRRERAMLRFRRMQSLQKIAFDHASASNRVNKECHPHARDNYRLNRTAALIERRGLFTE